MHTKHMLIHARSEARKTETENVSVIKQKKAKSKIQTPKAKIGRPKPKLRWSNTKVKKLRNQMQNDTTRWVNISKLKRCGRCTPVSKSWGRKRFFFLGITKKSATCRRWRIYPPNLPPYKGNSNCNQARDPVTLSRSASTPRLEDKWTTIVSLHYWSNTKVATKDQNAPAP